MAWVKRRYLMSAGKRAMESAYTAGHTFFPFNNSVVGVSAGCITRESGLRDLGVKLRCIWLMETLALRNLVFPFRSSQLPALWKRRMGTTGKHRLLLTRCRVPGLA